MAKHVEKKKEGRIINFVIILFAFISLSHTSWKLSSNDETNLTLFSVNSKSFCELLPSVIANNLDVTSTVIVFVTFSVLLE